MINREIIRTKVVQLAYAWHISNSDTPAAEAVAANLTKAEKELLFSLSKSHELYLQLLGLIVALRDEAEAHWTLGKSRALREGQGSIASRNFIDNKFALQLKDNEQRLTLMEKKESLWAENTDVVRQLWQLIQETQFYKDYQQQTAPSYEDDKELWRNIYKAVVGNNDAIEDTLEEYSLYWNDDKAIVDTFVLKTIKAFRQERGAQQTLLDEYRNDQDRQFALELFRATVEKGDELRGFVSQISKNWDTARLSTIDLIILQTAIAEMLTFPEIALQVTINEYIELAKIYSTPKSAGYVNGMLDAAARLLIERQLIFKRLNN